MKNKRNIALFVSFVTGFNVLSGNVSLLPAFADDDGPALVSFSCPSTAWGFSQKFVDRCYREGNKKLKEGYKKLELQKRRKQQKKINEANAQARESINRNIDTAATQQEDPYTKNANAAARQRYLMDNQTGSVPFMRTGTTSESQKELDRLDNQIRAERGMAEARRKERDAHRKLLESSILKK
jgi:hypothetical protein